jgi:hypothetical protein
LEVFKMKTIYEMSTTELREIAKAKLMPGAWKAKKAEMIAWLESRGYQNEPELTEEPQTNNYKSTETEPTESVQEPTECGSDEDDWFTGAIVRRGEDGKLVVEHRKNGKLVQNEPQDEPYDTSEAKSNNYKTKDSKAPERSQRAYGAWVVDRETKEITTVVAEAESREEFYSSIKDKYRVRLITKPEKLEEECKQWEIKHAQNKIKKNEKYAADKAEATKMNMSIKEYRKWLKESDK